MVILMSIGHSVREERTIENSVSAFSLLPGLHLKNLHAKYKGVLTKAGFVT